MPAGLDPFAAVPEAEAERFPFARVVPVSTGTISAGKSLMPLRGKLVGYSVIDAAENENEIDTPATNTPAAGSNASITVTGVAGVSAVLRQLIVSLSGTVAATSTVTVKDGATTKLSVVLPATAGLYSIPLSPDGIKITAGNDLVVTATSPGAAGVASLNIVTSSTATEATFDLYDGGDATGQYLGSIALPLGGGETKVLGEHGPTLQSGLYINPTSGVIKGSFWIRQEPT